MQIIIVDLIAVILVGMLGGFGASRSLTDFASGMWITGIALMGIGVFSWMSRISPRNATYFDMLLGFDKGTRFYLQERAYAYTSIEFWIAAGLTPFVIGAIIAIFIR